MACAYHNEARRRERVLERKKEAMNRLKVESSECGQITEQQPMKESIAFSGPGDYDVNRSIYNWIGKERCRRQYDHSRNGPLLDSTWYSLKHELNTIGQCMPLSSGEGRSLAYQDLLRTRVITPKK